MPCISTKNNLLLNHRQCKKDLLRCLKVAEAQGCNKAKSLQLLCACCCVQANTHIPCSNSENSSSSKCSASKQEEVRLVGGKKANKKQNKKGLKIKDAGTPVFVNYIWGLKREKLKADVLMYF